jgi:acetyl-CoA carboxylase biotin carboxyl carrier protein
MDLQKLKKITELFNASGLTELELTEGDVKIVLKKTYELPKAIPSYNIYEEKSALPSIPVEKAAEKPSQTVDSANEIKAPLAGVLYLSPAPNEKSFVSVGDTVKAGDTLCIIEAMKVMNEISATKDGKIIQICADNEQIVEFGQILFKIG